MEENKPISQTLQKINKESITELKCFMKPPAKVGQVCSILVMLLEDLPKKEK